MHCLALRVTEIYVPLPVTGVGAMAMSNADRQREWRKRQKERPRPAPVPAFNPATQIVLDRSAFDEMGGKLREALVRIELLEEDRARWRTDCARAEAELRLERQHHLNTIKDKIVLKQQMSERTAIASIPRKRR